MPKKKFRRASLLMAVLALSLTACISRVETTGNLPDPGLINEIKPGEVNRDDVRELLGSPSAVTTFGEERWYYISQRTETVAFLEPEVKERHVLIVKFDKKGMVTGVDKKSLEDGRDVEIVDRETPTTGSDFSVLQQLFGNIGRFPAQAGGAPNP
jgi:outer membrane protein assembly factor BamE (lipoprotein component of BamABCDE complex)